METTWDMGTTGIRRPCGDNMGTMSGPQRCGDHMETTLGQHEDNVETTWGPCGDNMGNTGMWRPHGDTGDNMGTA